MGAARRYDSKRIDLDYLADGERRGAYALTPTPGFCCSSHSPRNPHVAGLLLLLGRSQATTTAPAASAIEITTVSASISTFTSWSCSDGIGVVAPPKHRQQTRAKSCAENYAATMRHKAADNDVAAPHASPREAGAVDD